jgi:hypothetical protein
MPDDLAGAVRQYEPPQPPARETVWVACKLPHGLILRLFHFEKSYEAVMGGGVRETAIARQHGDTVRLNGNTFPFGTMPRHRIEGGFGITENVSKAFWDEWWSQNQELAAVKNRLIFAFPDVSSTTDEAKKMESVKSGLEPLDPQKLPRTGIPGVTLEPGTRL